MLGWKISNGQRKSKLKGNFWNLKTLTYESQWWHRSTCWGGTRRGQNRTRRSQDTWNFWAVATAQTIGLITEAWATCQTLRDWAILQPETNSYRLCPWSRNPFLHPWTKGSPPLLFHFLSELLQREERESLESKHIFTQVILSLESRRDCKIEVFQYHSRNGGLRVKGHLLIEKWGKFHIWFLNYACKFPICCTS